VRSRATWIVAVFGILAWAGDAGAQALAPPNEQFDVLGFVQEATLDTGGAICPALDRLTGLPSDRLRGGTLTVNGIKMIVPCNTLLQLPANTMTWGDLFNPDASQPVGSYIGWPATPVPANPRFSDLVRKTGLALADVPGPFPSFEVRVQGNVVNGQYLVGLIIPVTQQGLNASSGKVSYIDYGIGAFRVGGVPSDPFCAPASGGITSRFCSGALVQINDPVGRWGLPHSPDPRFSGDNENTTVHASTGIPACIPRSDPALDKGKYNGVLDPLCPYTNRPLNGDRRFPTDDFLAIGAPLKKFDMPAPAAADLDPTLPDPRQQVPILVGDQVVYSGTLYKINPLDPDGSAANTYVSAHTVEDVLGVFTQPGVPPAYIAIEDLLIGTGGAAVQGILQEASTRLTVVGFTTDPTRLVDTYAVDVNPCTGQESLRLLATTDPGADAIKGRFVHRVLGGLFMPPTRMYVIKSRTQFRDIDTGLPVDYFAANGILTGQYSLPNFEYIFPENHALGDPTVPFNFQDLPFLALGSGPVDGFGTGSPALGQLDPWPASIPGAPPPPQAVCGALGLQPIVNAGADITVGTDAQVLLAGTVAWDPNNSLPGSRKVQWTQVAGTPVTLANPGALASSFIAPSKPDVLVFSLAASDNIAVTPVTDTVSITVKSRTDVVQIIAAAYQVQNGKKGSFGKLNVTAATNDPTAILSLTEVARDGTTQEWGTGTANAAVPGQFDWVEIKGVKPPASLTITSTKGGSATVTCSAPAGTLLITCP
jgi:hypothetical protein